MPNIRAQVRLQGASLLPEDVYVNTYHFVRLDDVEDAADAITPDFEDLYSQLNTYSFPAYIQREAEVRYYDLADAMPRVPTIRTFSLPTAAGLGSIPFEVAMVVSFHGEPPVTARRRGRVYIGPMNDQCVDFTSTDAPSIISGCAASAGGAFGAFLDAQPAWRIRSTVPSENFVPVVGGWVDNEFDTQRRRGHTASQRIVWLPPGP